MKLRNIIIILIIVAFSSLGILYARSGGQLKGMFNAPSSGNAPGEKSGRIAAEPISIKTKYEKPDFAITKGKFIAMVAKAVMTKDEARNAKNLKTCSAVRDFQGFRRYEIFLNYACEKEWSGMKSVSGMRVEEPIARLQAAEMLARAFRIAPADYSIYRDIKGNSYVNPLGAAGIFEEINTGGNFLGEELLGEQTAKNWIRKLKMKKRP